jgi:hypothetical protein
MDENAAVQLNGISTTLTSPWRRKKPVNRKHEKIRKTNLKTSWSIKYPSTTSPPNRIGAFSCYIEATDQVLIGYGNEGNKKFYNDIWLFNFKDYSWTSFPVTGFIAEGRTEAKACIVGSCVYVFGGHINGTCRADFHVIDLNTYECRAIETNEMPPPRTGHVMASYQNKIVVWGGICNHHQFGDLWIYDVSKNEWRAIVSSIPGRSYSAYTLSGDDLYITCASKIDDMIVFNFTTEKIDSFTVTGSLPIYNVKGASFLTFGEFLILIGGYIDEQRFSLVKVFDTVRRCWFVLNVFPDNNTATVADGDVDSEGNFLVPRMFGGFAVFRPTKRQICISLGEPMTNPPPLYIFNVGKGMSIAHHQLDIISVLK